MSQCSYSSLVWQWPKASLILHYCVDHTAHVDNVLFVAVLMSVHIRISWSVSRTQVDQKPLYKTSLKDVTTDFFTSHIYRWWALTLYRHLNRLLCWKCNTIDINELWQGCTAAGFVPAVALTCLLSYCSGSSVSWECVSPSANSLSALCLSGLNCTLLLGSECPSLPADSHRWVLLFLSVLCGKAFLSHSPPHLCCGRTVHICWLCFLLWCFAVSSQSVESRLLLFMVSLCLTWKCLAVAYRVKPDDDLVTWVIGVAHVCPRAGSECRFTSLLNCPPCSFHTCVFSCSSIKRWTFL